MLLPLAVEVEINIKDSTAIKQNKKLANNNA